jgi:hypothetical protein
VKELGKERLARSSHERQAVAWRRLLFGINRRNVLGPKPLRLLTLVRYWVLVRGQLSGS